MRTKWKPSICSRFYPLVIVVISVVLWLAILFSLLLIEGAIYDHNYSALKEKFDRLEVGMTKEQVMGIMGLPQRVETIRSGPDTEFLDNELPERIQKAYPVTILYEYQTKGIFDWLFDHGMYPFRIFLDEDDRAIVYISKAFMFSFGFYVPFPIRPLGRWGSLAVIFSLVWLGFRSWCRRVA